MPGLTAADRKEMLGKLESQPCPKCKQGIHKHYCRQDDAFYFVCGCQADGDNNHKGHRTYQCQEEDEGGQCRMVMEHHCPKCDKYVCWVCALKHECGVTLHSLDPQAYEGKRDDGSDKCQCSLMG